MKLKIIMTGNKINCNRPTSKYQKIRASETFKGISKSKESNIKRSNSLKGRIPWNKKL